MVAKKSRPKGKSRGASALVPALVACFFASGVASLVLEVVWSRLLRLVFGSTTLAVSTVLVAYMLGLGLGGVLGGRRAERLRNGARAYGWMEIAIGVYALVVPLALRLLPALQRALVADLSFWPAALARFAAVLLLLLVPTVLMGATLPVLVAAVAPARSAVARRVGLLYGLNTLGAMTGALLAAFVLFPALGVAKTNAAAAGLDVAVGLLALLVLAPRVRSRAPASTAARSPAPAAAASPSTPRRPRLPSPYLLATALVGLTALTYEVAWTRALSMVLGSSIYAFATMLAAFLAGIALGSLAVRRRVDRLADPGVAFAIGVAALGVLSLAPFLALGALPDFFLALLEKLGDAPGAVVTVELVTAAAAMLLPTLVLGALFPLVVRALAARPPAARPPAGAPAATPADAPGGSPSSSASLSSLVGDVYFFNTLGSAAGAFLAGFVVIPAIGLRRTLGAAAALDLLVAALLLLLARPAGPGLARPRRAVLAAALVAAAVLLLLAPPGWDAASLTRGVYRTHLAEERTGIELLPLAGVRDEEILFYRDGVSATVSVHRDGGDRKLRVNGKVDAGTGTDMPTQVLLGEVPMLFGPPADRVLVIGLASGVTVGSVALHAPSALDVVEIEPAMVAASHLFDDVNHRPLDRPGVRVIPDDGRTYLAGCRDRYDVIVAEPSNPWMTGAASLFTREFFQEARRSLAPGGRLFQWLPLYEIDPKCVLAVLASLQGVFPHVYGFLHTQLSPDLLLLATETPLDAGSLPDWSRLPAPVRDDLRRIDVHSTADLWTLLRITPEDVASLVPRAPALNTDDGMYVELETPWTIFRTNLGIENARMLLRPTRGVLPVAERSGPLPADFVGELVASYADGRNDPRIAREMLGRLAERGPDGERAARWADLAVRLVDGDAAPDRQVAMADSALALVPASFVLRWHKARALADAGRTEEALAEVDRAVTVAPEDPRGLALRARVLEAVGRKEEAAAAALALTETSYEQADPELWLVLARSALAGGRAADARKAAERYLLRVPGGAAGWSVLADAAEAEGRPSEAALARENARTAARNFLLNLHRLARLQAPENPTQAVRTLQVILQMDPDYAPAREDLRRLGG